MSLVKIDVDADNVLARQFTDLERKNLPFAVMQFVGGLFFCGIHPSINAVLASNTPPSYKGRIFGMLFAAQQVGSMAGPLLGGLIATYLGIHCVFAFSGLLLLCLSSAIWHRYRGQRGC